MMLQPSFSVMLLISLLGGKQAGVRVGTFHGCMATYTDEGKAGPVRMLVGGVVLGEGCAAAPAFSPSFFQGFFFVFLTFE